jgi:hypothetical protein
VTLTASPASRAVTGGTSVSSITLISGRIGMPMPSDHASTPFMPRSAWSVRLSQVKPAPSARASTAMPRRYDASRTRPTGTPGVKPRSRSAFVTTLTELIAIAALASTGSSSRPSHQYRAPAATGISSTL